MSPQADETMDTLLEYQLGVTVSLAHGSYWELLPQMVSFVVSQKTSPMEAS